MIKHAQEEIRAVMTALGVTQAQLADRVGGIDGSSVSRRLSRPDTRMSALDELVEALGMKWLGIDELELVAK